jgi:hypothetical protein
MQHSTVHQLLNVQSVLVVLTGRLHKLQNGTDTTNIREKLNHFAVDNMIIQETSSN